MSHLSGLGHFESEPWDYFVVVIISVGIWAIIVSTCGRVVIVQSDHAKSGRSCFKTHFVFLSLEFFFANCKLIGKFDLRVKVGKAGFPSKGQYPSIIENVAGAYCIPFDVQLPFPCF